ncbi:MAG: hypothetical protein HYX69_06495 [Planctomycetia bacterium]|nr:hypothetical protein [Planctomycetia bacterium]
MNMRSATLVAIAGLALALLLRLGMFARDFLRLLDGGGGGGVAVLATVAIYCAGDVLAYGSLLVFFVVLRRSLNQQAGH